MSKPLSAITLSPGSSRGKRSEDNVSFLLETRPDHSLDTKVMAPFGDIPISAFHMLWFLQSHHLCDWDFKEEGTSINSSVQSMMTLVEELL